MNERVSSQMRLSTEHVMTVRALIRFIYLIMRFHMTVEIEPAIQYHIQINTMLRGNAINYNFDKKKLTYL